jgi:hypothetical protein
MAPEAFGVENSVKPGESFIDRVIDKDIIVIDPM